MGLIKEKMVLLRGLPNPEKLPVAKERKYLENDEIKTLGENITVDPEESETAEIIQDETPRPVEELILEDVEFYSTIKNRDGKIDNTFNPMRFVQSQRWLFNKANSACIERVPIITMVDVLPRRMDVLRYRSLADTYNYEFEVYTLPIIIQRISGALGDASVKEDDQMYYGPYTFNDIAELKAIFEVYEGERTLNPIIVKC